MTAIKYFKRFLLSVYLEIRVTDMDSSHAKLGP